MQPKQLTNVRKELLVTLIPDGVYEGTQSGYTVVFTTPDGDYKADSPNGVRGMNVPCIVTASAGVLTLSYP